MTTNNFLRTLTCTMALIRLGLALTAAVGASHSSPPPTTTADRSISLVAGEGIGLTLTNAATGWQHTTTVDGTAWLSSGPFAAATNGATVYSTAQRCAPHCLLAAGEPNQTSGSDITGQYNEVTHQCSHTCFNSLNCDATQCMPTTPLDRTGINAWDDSCSACAGDSLYTPCCIRQW
jgi:hypothetical protein